MKEMMTQVGVTLAKRYTSQQKKLFLEEAAKLFRQDGLSTGEITEQTKMYRVSHLTAGDLQHAKHVFAAAYDTPSRMLLSGSGYAPFNPDYNLKAENRNLMLECVLTVLCFLGIWYLSRGWASGSVWMRILIVLAIAVLAYGAFQLMKGKANEVNFNRSSAAAAVLLDMASEDCPDTAYVLLDRSVNSYEGLKILAGHLQKGQELIYLDALASGETLVVGHRAGTDASKLMESLSNTQPREKAFDEEKARACLLQFAENMKVITAGRAEGANLLVRPSRSDKDYAIDMDRLEKIRNDLVNYTKRG